MEAPKILFVDDEEKILNALKRQFLEDDIYIITTTDPLQALEFLKKEEICVLVSDNLMPGMNGIELLFKARSVSPDTVRIMLTGYVDVKVVIDAINRGAIYKFVTKPWDDEELKSIVFDSIYRYKTVKSMKEAGEDDLYLIAQTIEMKDRHTKGHCDRVAEYALMIADALSLDEAIKEDIKYGAWLHDCGKLGVPEKILNKNSSLSYEEMHIIKKHTVWGADVASSAGFSERVINIIRYHHERYDGGGYPEGLKGDMIPIEARIVNIADIFDVLTSDRPYRKKLSIDEAISIIDKDKGKVSDPELVDIFINQIKKG
ncbi:MAG: HD domain-containing protein [Syntrophorhabdaceae bacterium]|nr:HD domain-containing protein [Syntrophorhabdaceae bacterium]